MLNKQIIQKPNKAKYFYAVLSAFITYIFSCLLFSYIYQIFDFDINAGIACLMCYGCSCPSGIIWFVSWPAFILSSLVFSLMFPKRNKYYKLVIWGIFCVIIICCIFYTIEHINLIKNIIKANIEYRRM
ncbi:MAG: hypothetical protein IKN73_01375 [Alphaproteobacteria bacterium]|nr:hypothetical protein [Alphaproteobacteria bacterium]